MGTCDITELLDSGDLLTCNRHAGHDGMHYDQDQGCNWVLVKDIIVEKQSPNVQL